MLLATQRPFTPTPLPPPPFFWDKHYPEIRLSGPSPPGSLFHTEEERAPESTDLPNEYKIKVLQNIHIVRHALILIFHHYDCFASTHSKEVLNSHKQIII